MIAGRNSLRLFERLFTSPIGADYRLQCVSGQDQQGVAPAAGKPGELGGLASGRTQSRERGRGKLGLSGILTTSQFAIL
jgi:hypothetical protein